MTRTDTAYSYEHADECITTVQGVEYLVWANFARRGMFAQCVETGEIKMIKSRGYINKDLTARKAIMVAFNLDSFRK